jgi:hypothetical protein
MSTLPIPIYNVVSPTGGFANHIRWLMLLDNRYSSIIIPDNFKPIYEKYQGGDWPTYHNFIIHNYHGIDQSIIDEMNNILPMLNFTTPDYKLHAYKRHVYPTNRTWHNWLRYEHQWRVLLNRIIEMKHAYTELTNINNKTLILTIDPFLAYKSYIKFNSYCNELTLHGFQSSILTENAKHLTITNKNTLILNVDILFNELLDRAWYQQLITWFDLDDNYSTACIVHKLWYDAHKRAEQDIIQDLTRLYSTNSSIEYKLKEYEI